jgi:methylthioribulose-1-phosphate dehydratase
MKLSTARSSEMDRRVAERVAEDLVTAGRRFDARGWTLGTSGNFSVVISRKPLHIAITASGAAKGNLSTDDIVLIDRDGRSLDRTRSPSAEALLHLAIVKRRGASAVFHTHSLWATTLSERYAVAGGVALEGFEMLKGLAGVTTHAYREWLPILENRQDMPVLAREVSRTLVSNSSAHGFLLRRHGLYTWGASIAEATRHVEALEFLLEAFGHACEVPGR